VWRVRALMRGPGVQRYRRATCAVGVLGSGERQLSSVEGDVPRRAAELANPIFELHPPAQYRQFRAQSVQLRRDYRVDDERSSFATHAQEAGDDDPERDP